MKALHEEGHATSIQDLVSKVATNKMRKRVTFCAIKLVTKLDHSVHVDVNLMFAWQTMLVCLKKYNCPLFYNCMIDLFDFLDNSNTETWWEEKGAHMPHFPTYIVIMIDKLLKYMIPDQTGNL